MHMFGQYGTVAGVLRYQVVLGKLLLGKLLLGRRLCTGEVY